MTEDIEQFKAERGALALAAEEGDAQAAKRLDEVERALTRASKAEGRKRLADQERARLAAEAEREAIERTRRDAERALARLAAEQVGNARRLEESTISLCLAIGEMVDRGDEMSNIGLGLGGTAFAHDSRILIREYVRGQLALVLPRHFEQADHAMRGRNFGDYLADRLRDLTEERAR